MRLKESWKERKKEERQTNERKERDESRKRREKETYVDTNVKPKKTKMLETKE